MRLLVSILALSAALLPVPVHAYELSGDWADKICDIVPCTGGGGGAAGLSTYVFSRVIASIQVIFIAVAFVMYFYYAAALILWSHDETNVSESKTAYAHIITGGAIVSLAHLIVLSFSPVETGADIVHPLPIIGGFANALFYFKIILATALTYNLVLQGTRIIVAQGTDELDQAKKRLLHGFVGVGIVLLANAIVVGVNPHVGAPSGAIAVEIRGIANYLLAIFGVLVVLAIIVAGIILVVSIDEQLKDRGKQIVKTSVIALAVVLAAFALVNAFITLPTTSP